MEINTDTYGPKLTLTTDFTKKMFIELCDKMIQSKINIEWSCFTRVNLVDKELLEKISQTKAILEGNKDAEKKG